MAGRIFPCRIDIRFAVDSLDRPDPPTVGEFIRHPHYERGLAGSEGPTITETPHTEV